MGRSWLVGCALACATESTTSTGAVDPTTTETSTGVGPQDTGSSEPGTSTTGNFDEPCFVCLEDSAPCTCTDSCEVVAGCVYSGTDPALCCTDGPPGHADDWNAFIACALSEGCAGVCGDPPDCG